MKDVSTRKSTHLLKKLLKERFGITVSVKSESYSGGSSLRIKYDLGPDTKVVNKIVSCLQEGSFNGMEDIYEYDKDRPDLVVDGCRLQSFKYVFVEQEMDDDLNFKMAKFLSDNMKFSGVPELETKEQLNDTFSERFGSAWTWGQLFRQMFRHRNFVTQDASKINLLSVHSSENDNWGIYFIYEVDGQKYNTEEWPEKKVKSKPETPGKVQVNKYSDKSIAVQGDTYPIRGKLKALGGRFNKRLNGGPGWIFPISKVDELKRAFL